MLRRRTVLQSLFSLGLISILQPSRYSWAINRFNELKIGQNDPFLQLMKIDLKQIDFAGDQIDKTHEALWDIEKFVSDLGGWPTIIEQQELVIVGGGMSGLISAYLHSNNKPVILELDKQFGGNSKGEIFNQHQTSVGAAYITIPDDGSAIEKMLIDLELKDQFKLENDSSAQFIFKNQKMQNFWSGISDPECIDQFVRLSEHLRNLSENKYPDIPWTNESQISYQEYLQLDQINFKDWLLNYAPNLHHHILEFFQLYAWSSFTGSIEEISALQMLNFILSEVDGVLALPGGNAKIAHQLVEHLKNKLGTSKLRSQSMVIRVIQKNDSCETTYLDQSGALKTIRSNHVILSCQKMIATRICPQMPEEQIRAIRRIQYRGYIVANIYFNQKNQPPAFDLFCMKGIYPEQPTAMKQAPFKITDIIFADWAQSTLTENDPDKSTTVLTAYCPLPFDGARQFLFNPIAFEKFKKAILQEILELAPSLNLDPQKIDSIRLQRWGHSLPVARTNFFSTNDYSMINQTINNRIHFANQDNYINPAFESAFAAADRIKLNNQA